MNRREPSHVTDLGGLRRALLGTVVGVENTGGDDSAYGDFRLHYADGRVVLIDGGHVGATVYVEKEAR